MPAESTATSTVITLLQLVAGTRRYLADPASADWMRPYDPVDRPTHDERNRPIVYADLATLLGEMPAHASGGHVLGIQGRRQSVGLIVARVETLAEAAVLPLAPLLAARLKRPWVRGVALCADQPVVMLDLRALALDALAIRQQ